MLDIGSDNQSSPSCQEAASSQKSNFYDIKANLKSGFLNVFIVKVTLMSNVCTWKFRFSYCKTRKLSLQVDFQTLLACK